MKKSSKKYFGFTLVELIIVITILAILATIAFVSFQNYTSQTRDTKRVSDLTQISKGLDIFQVTSGTLPTPDNPTTYTGGNVTLLKGKINSKVLSNLGGEVLDPSSKTEYTYAIIGNGKYYQLGADSENLVTSVFTNTYADAKSSIVKGNYLFDPSLPSLIISSGSSLYDPNNCFVVNGGTNLVSNNTNCTPKSSTSLKNFDSSLVGYWDMESTSGGLLKDLSGNGNDGTFSGGMIYSSALTGGILGKGLYFNGGYISTELNQSFSGLDWPNSNITITAISKVSNVINDGIGCEFQNTAPIFSTYRYGLNSNGGHFNTTQNGNEGVKTFAGNPNPTGFKNEWIISVFKKDGDDLSYFENGKLIGKSKRDFEKLPGYYITQPIIGGTHHCSATFSTKAIGIIEEVKFYNRALSDEEILGQAKSAGF